MARDYDEKRLYGWLRRRFDHPKLDMQRVETFAGSGVPDVNFCHGCCEGWMELKVATVSKNDDGELRLKFKWRPAQLAWGFHRERCGGYTRVVAAVVASDWNKLQSSCRLPADDLKVLAFKVSDLRQYARSSRKLDQRLTVELSLEQLLRLDCYDSDLSRALRGEPRINNGN